MLIFSLTRAFSSRTLDLEHCFSLFVFFVFLVEYDETSIDVHSVSCLFLYSSSVAVVFGHSQLLQLYYFQFLTMLSIVIAVGADFGLL
jgi:hypothetical protein